MRLGAVIDQPLRPPVHRLEYLQPARVGGGQQLDQFGLQIERLAERLALLGLAHRVEQHLDRLVVPGSAERAKWSAASASCPERSDRAAWRCSDPPAGAAVCW